MWGGGLALARSDASTVVRLTQTSRMAFSARVRKYTGGLQFHRELNVWVTLAAVALSAAWQHSALLDENFHTRKLEFGQNQSDAKFCTDFRNL